MDSTAPDPIARLLASPPDLPVVVGLPRLRTLLAGAGAGAAGPAASAAGPASGASPAPVPASTVPAPAVVVTAPPGTGKTTLVPPLVADVVARLLPDGAGRPRRVVVTQPRRVAARAAARRLAALLGEPVGRTVGYAVRGERVVGRDTRIEIVTAGLLLRRLQDDPELSGAAAVVLDEVHERSLDSDLLLALLLDARGALREDLRLVAMSATADLTRLPDLLGAPGSPAPVLDVPSPLHPIAEHWAPPPSAVARLGPHGVPREFLAHVAATAERALGERPGDALVFLPGAREVDDVVARLRRALPESVDVLPLHGRLPAAAQDAALAPSAPGRRRVVVSTNVAESSLTVSGVRIVVDSTLTRRPRLDVARAMSGLVTVGVSRSAGIQRAGRAGREGPGAVHRCCTPVDWARSPQAPSPEIASADLTRAALELAVWGAPDGAGLSWIEPPPEAAMRVARRTLAGLGLVEDGEDGAVTALGRAVAALPAEVREARALLAAARRIGIRRAAEAAALLTADLRAPAADLTALARRVREGGAVGRTWRAEAKRLEAAASRADSAAVVAAPPASSSAPPSAAPVLPSAAAPPAPAPAPPSAAPAPSSSTSAGLSAPAVSPATASPPGPAGDGYDGYDGRVAGLAQTVGVVSALARPEWIARRRGPAPMPGRSASYATVGGTGVQLPPDSPLASSPWLAVADVDLAPGRGDALIRAAAPIDEELALDVAAHWLVQEERTGWVGGRLRSERVRRLGAIELAVAPAGAPSPAAVADAVVAACREQGPGILPWEGGAAGLRARLALLHRELGEPWPAMDDDSLLARAGDWLAPAVEQLAARSRRFDLGALDLTTALRALLPWPQAARLDELVPERIEVPSGSRVRVEYGACGERPVLAVRVQECFGWEETPRVVDGRVPVLLHLLSPARRPVAVTDDLRSFWAGPYQQVRREMRGRYPKHAWPEDPRRPGRPEGSSPTRRGPRPSA